jgi:hypothetical protein
MKEWGDKQDLLRRLEAARADARETVFPKHAGDDTLQAAMFVAMLNALNQWAEEQPATLMPASTETAAPSAPALPPPEQPPMLPEVNYGPT